MLIQKCFQDSLFVTWNMFVFLGSKLQGEKYRSYHTT